LGRAPSPPEAVDFVGYIPFKKGNPIIAPTIGGIAFEHVPGSAGKRFDWFAAFIPNKLNLLQRRSHALQSINVIFGLVRNRKIANGVHRNANKSHRLERKASVGSCGPSLAWPLPELLILRR